MNSFPNATVDAVALRKLYKDSDGARFVFDHLVTRQRNSSVTTVDRVLRILQRDGHEIARSDVIDFFRKVEDLECGKFVIGRRGHSSRFEWTVQMIGVGRAATGEEDVIERISEEQQMEEEGTEEHIKHTYVLRPDTDVTFELPADLTTAEAERLANLVRTLPFESR